jgi:hypothetical protein
LLYLQSHAEAAPRRPNSSACRLESLKVGLPSGCRECSVVNNAPETTGISSVWPAKSCKKPATEILFGGGPLKTFRGHFSPRASRQGRSLHRLTKMVMMMQVVAGSKFCRGQATHQEKKLLFIRLGCQIRSSQVAGQWLDLGRGPTLAVGNRGHRHTWSHSSGNRHRQWCWHLETVFPRLSHTRSRTSRALLNKRGSKPGSHIETPCMTR